MLNKLKKNQTGYITHYPLDLQFLRSCSEIK